MLKGKAKKVIAISSGMADLDLINDSECDIAPLYSANKAALNVLVAKYSALYKKDGVLFFTLSPGVVDVGKGANGMYLSPPPPSSLEKRQKNLNMDGGLT